MAGVTAGGIWSETRAVVARHAGVFATLAGATVFLPNAATRLLVPAPAAPGVDATAAGQLPPGLLLLIGIGLVLQIIGVFAIAAISADAREGGGRTLGATLAAAIPAIGRFVLAMLLFLLAYAGLTIVLSLIVAIIGAIFGAASPGARAGAGPDPLVLAKSVLVVVVPVMVWLWARLSPLVGVYLREEVGVVDGVRRAWLLSKGATWQILALLSVFLFATIIVGSVQLSATAAVGAGLPGMIVALLFSALGALLFVYAAAGTGVVYRQLAA